MREGLRTLADLVEKIEVGGVEVDDVSLSRAGGGALAVDISVRLPADERVEVPDGDPETPGGGTPAGAALYRGGGTAARQASAGGRSVDAVDPGFGALSAGVGGTVAGSIDETTVVAGDGGAGPLGTTGEADPGGTAPEGAESAASSSTDEPIECRVEGCSETFGTEHGMKIHATKAHQADDGSAPSPHRDPERLREVYDACDTFEEMTDALGVDVTAQTVRRSMMSLGIHDPDAGDDAAADRRGTGSDHVVEDDSSDVADPEGGDGPSHDGVSQDEGSRDGPSRDEGSRDAAVDEGPGVVEDAGGPGAVDDVDGPAAADAPGSGPAVDDLLPDGIDGAAFVDAVRDADTLYEVHRDLGVERGAVQTLLAELGLLDLVHGRVATKPEREVGREEIERRIVERASGDADGSAGTAVGAK